MHAVFSALVAWITSTFRQIVEAFPWDEAPRSVLRDRDSTYGGHFPRRVTNLRFEEVVISRRNPWQNRRVGRVIGSIRRECLDHVVVLSDRHLKRILRSYLGYNHGWRTHQSLEMDAPARGGLICWASSHRQSRRA